MAALFVVDDPGEVMALLRALFAAKFHAPDDGPELAGSPILARLCERAMAAFAAAQETGRLSGNAEQTRATWSLPPGPHIVESVRRHLKTYWDVGNWPGLSPAERAEFARELFRPYVAEESVVWELVNREPHAEPRDAIDGDSVIE